MSSSPPSRRRGHRSRAIRFWFFLHLGVPVLRTVAWLHSRTLRVRWEGREHWEAAKGRPHILAFWHGDMVGLALAFRFVGGRASARTICMLTSPSRDGRLNDRFLKKMGCETAVGSSAKRGVTALLALNRAIERGLHAGLAVDGPRGPRHEAKPGAAALSKSSGAAILPFTITASRCRRLGDWAQTEVPRLFSTLTIRVAPPRTIDDVDEGTAWLTETLQSMKPESVDEESGELGGNER
jgi:lysophospholipid acyltransferase (LPLAT)-like uncharacterized protein